MGSLDDRDLRLIEGARRRGVQAKGRGRKGGDPGRAEDDTDTSIDLTHDIDLDNDPAPQPPKMITLPRDVVLATLRDVQDFSFKRALWGRRLIRPRSLNSK